MTLQIVPWPPDVVSAITRVAHGLTVAGTVADTDQLSAELQVVATAFWEDATGDEIISLVEQVLSSRAWNFAAAPPAPCPLTDTPRSITREDVDGRQFLKVMDARTFICSFEADGTFIESPMTDPVGALTGQWALADGRLTTEVVAGDGLYRTLCVGLRGARAFRIHESHNNRGFWWQGLFLESAGPEESTLTEFPGPWDLWVKIGQHRQTLLAIQKDGSVAEHDLSHGLERWAGTIPGPGQLHIGPWHLRIAAGSGSEVPIPYRGTETRPGESEVNEFWLAPILPLASGGRLRDWATD